MKLYLRLATAAVAIFASIPVSAAEGQGYLLPQKAAAILADGVPWSAHAPNGRTFKLTLNRDGTGSIGGPLMFTLSVNWGGERRCDVHHQHDDFKVPSVPRNSWRASGLERGQA